MAKAITPGELFFLNVRTNFERANITGTVQVFSSEPEQQFFLTINDRSILYQEGTTPNFNATIKMHENILCDILTESSFYDARVLRFSSRLDLSGDVDLAKFVLDLIKTPSPAVRSRLALAREKNINNQIDSIKRVNRPSKHFINETMKEFRPVIMTGMLESWNVSTWNPNFLKENFGETKIASYFSGTLKDFVDEMIAPTAQRGNLSKIYTDGVGLPGIFWRHFPRPPVLQDDAILAFPQLWLGKATDPKRAVTGLHCDCVHGFLCHVYGTKRVLLYSPDQEESLYPFRAFNQYRPCWTGPENPDYDTYPLFRNARSIEAIIEPGEILFIPLGWFHCVFALSMVMSITFPIDYLADPVLASL